MNASELISLCIKYTKNCSEPTDIGSLVNKTDSDTSVISTSEKEIERVIVFSKNNKISKLNFIFNKEELSIKDMLEKFDDFQYGYSFRDNITKFKFDSNDSILSSISTKINDNVEINNNDILIKTPQGITNKRTVDEKIFKSIMFEL